MIKLIPTILSGGSGSRLWPVSREMQPKPFIKLKDGQSFIQKAFLRAASQQNVAEVLTVTNRDFYFKTQDEFKSLNLSVNTSYILEPFGKNTAAAIALATHHISKKHGSDAICLILTADHLIENQAAFAAAVNNACEIAQQGFIATFGIRPQSPETGYGYIERDPGQPLFKNASQNCAYAVKRFVEKPDLSTATEYLKSDDFSWNSGMFCFQASTMLNALQNLQPDLYQQSLTVFESSSSFDNQNSTQHRLEIDESSFNSIESISIDYAVMEKSNQVAVITCDIGWQDIGSWDAMSTLTPSDTMGNRVEGKAHLVETQNCYIHGEDRFIATLGLKNTIIVDTADALLIADKAHAQQVKDIYQHLKQTANPLYKHHKTVHRPWGSYTVLYEGPRFKIKSIIVLPQQSLSLQLHHHRSEHWVVVAGVAKVTNEEKNYTVNTNESTFIPAGAKHRLENPGLLNLEIIEVQSGEYVGEDDIVRLEDIYGRTERKD